MEPIQPLFKRIIKFIEYSITSLFWTTLWLFGLTVLLSFLMRWWPGDRIITVRFIDYFMPWLLLGLIPGLVTAGFTRRKWLAAILFAPVLLISLTYLPVFVKFADPAGSEGASLKVMSYNVWSKNPKVSEIASVIRQERPDILLLQEITAKRFHQLIKELTDLDPNDQLNSVFAPRMEQAVISRYQLTPLEENSQKGRAQKVQVETPGGRITVINIHAFKWGWLRRHRQMKRLLAEDIAGANDPIILGGDFNTSDQSQTYRLVTHYLNNAHWEAGIGFGFTYPSPAFRYRGRFSLPAVIRIDHIFYSNYFTPKRARTLARSGNSDHLPVVAELIINKDTHPVMSKSANKVLSR